MAISKALKYLICAFFYQSRNETRFPKKRFGIHLNSFSAMEVAFNHSMSKALSALYAWL
jgi:hypothetical protein